MKRFLLWLVAPTRRPLVYFAGALVLLIGTAVAFDVHERQVERHARDTAIARAAQITYENQIAACTRGKSVRQATRDNALASQKVYRVLGGFLKGARPRALAQSQDPNISDKSRTAAKASLKSIDAGIEALAVTLNIPPPPANCADVIRPPNSPPPAHHH